MRHIVLFIVAISRPPEVKQSKTDFNLIYYKTVDVNYFGSV